MECFHLREWLTPLLELSLLSLGFPICWLFNFGNRHILFSPIQKYQCPWKQYSFVIVQ
jgi:hypothetical protein